MDEITDPESGRLPDEMEDDDEEVEYDSLAERLMVQAGYDIGNLPTMQQLYAENYDLANEIWG